MKTHKHKVYQTTERPFFNCINPNHCNPAAHGGVILLRKCKCGAIKEILVNGKHVETSLWVEENKNE